MDVIREGARAVGQVLRPVGAPTMRAEMGQRPPILRWELHGRVLALARTVAIAIVTLTLIAYIHWLPRWIDERLNEASVTAGIMNDGLPYVAMAWAAVAVAIGAAVVWTGLGALVVWRRSRDLLGNWLFVSWVSAGVLTTDIPVILRMQREDPWAPFQLIVLFTANALVVPTFFFFPDGRFVPRFGWVLGAVWMAWSFVRIITPAFDQGVARSVVPVALLASGIAAQVYRYVVRSDVVQKQQLKWLLLGFIAVLGTYAAVFAIPNLRPELLRPGPGFLYRTASSIVFSVSVSAVPVVMAIAVFRQGLLDINLILRRTLVYTALTVLLVAGFVLISSLANEALARLAGPQSEVVLLATALPLAFLFLPLRAALFRITDRFLSGRRVLTVMFVDIAGSTEHAVRLGDRAWRDLLGRFRVAVRGQLDRYGGDEIDTAGDGFFVTFAGSGRAIRCAHHIVEAVRNLGIEARAGVHIGEVEVYGDRVTGVAVHIGARLAGLAGPGEVLVSGALREQVAGSNIELQDRGEHQLKGVPGTSRVYVVAGT